MEVVLVAVAVFLLGCLAVFGFKQYRKVQNRKAEEERARNERQAYEAEQARLAALKRQRDFEEQTYNDFLSRFESLKQDLELFGHANYGYLMKKDWEPYPSKIQNALSEIEGFPQEYDLIYQFNENADFLRGYYPYDAWFKDRNGRFIEFEREHYAELFKNIDGKNLDEQQIRAVITDEFNNLIVAGAGSGKTLTVVGKIKRLRGFLWVGSSAREARSGGSST